jgi:hypothetical protein
MNYINLLKQIQPEETEASKDLGLFGSKKSRLQFKDDPANRFALSVLHHSKGNTAFKKKNNMAELIIGDEHYYVELSSIAKRMGISQSKVKELDAKHQLSKTFLDEVAQYTTELHKINEALSEIDTLKKKRSR